MKGNPAAVSIGNRIAPPRFIIFTLLTLIAAPIAISLSDWRSGSMIGFDIAALVFLLSLVPLFTNGGAESMRQAALRNDANRAILLAMTAIVMIVILVAIASELSAKEAPKPFVAGLVIGTLIIAWCFSNMIYTLHYAHLFYSSDDEGSDCAGIDFPETPEPDYWDFTYFSFTLGMTFQTSDVEISSRRIRRIVTLHCLAAFVFNLGVIAFTINVLGN